MRHAVYVLLDLGFSGDRNGRRLHGILIGLILVNVAAVVLESVPTWAAHFSAIFLLIEIVSIVVFTLEYAARMWVCVEHGPLRGLPAWKARLRYAVTPGMIIDLVAILPTYLALVIDADLRALLVFRLFRFFKVARYSTGMRSLADAIHSERQALAACAGILSGVVIVAASLMHLVEQDEQPDKFGTIPDAMYWAVVTLTTVGYGDVVPVTSLGKVIASITAVIGLGMIALPVGLLATAFADVIHRRDFVVTWGMVARVPLFRELDAQAVAEVMHYLRSQLVEPGEMIVRKGEQATCMYLIASGDVAVDMGAQSVTLSAGDFFGELALLSDTTRMATVRAQTRASLLVLDASDMHGLMERRPDVREHIQAVAAARHRPPDNSAEK